MEKVKSLCRTSFIHQSTLEDKLYEQTKCAWNSNYLIPLLFCLVFLFPNVVHAQNKPFITTWQTTTPNENIVISTEGGGYNYTVDWGDGTIETGLTADGNHTYLQAGIHTIKITGSFPRIYFFDSFVFNSPSAGNENKILSVDQWGDIAWSSMKRAFFNCSNMDVTATDTPNLSNLTDMSQMFQRCTSLVGTSAFQDWNTSTVTNMFQTFVNTNSFNQPIGGWDVSSVVNMQRMFQGATSFDQPLGEFDISSAGNMIDILNATALSTDNYDATLIGWATLNVANGETQIPSGINLARVSSSFCLGEMARSELINTYGWIDYTDNGKNCPDEDADGVQDSEDNCPAIANLDQLDLDEDGAGAVCDCDDNNPVVITQEECDNLDCPEPLHPDYNAIVAIYDSLNGPNWPVADFQNWHDLKNEVICDPCLLEGVTCTNNRVTRLLIQNQNSVSGQLPAIIQDLSSLEYLTLINNNLLGNIPPEIGNLSSLKFLSINNNLLSGEIPSEIGNLSSLVTLNISQNQLTGSIPTEIENINTLTGFVANDNLLSGPIPQEIGNVSSLEVLYLHNNELTGPIPMEIGNLSSLRKLWLGNNELSGEIPIEIGNLSALTTLRLSFNNLAGSIPFQLGNLSALTEMRLRANQLSGTIPPELGNLSTIQIMYLSSNDLEGCVPANISNLCGRDVWLYFNPQLGNQQDFANWCSSGQADSDNDGENVFCDCDDNDPDNGSTIALGSFEQVQVDAGMITGLGGGTPLGGVYSGVGVTDDGNGQTFTFDPSVAGEGIVSITYANIVCETSATSDIVVTSGGCPEPLHPDRAPLLDLYIAMDIANISDPNVTGYWNQFVDGTICEPCIPGVPLSFLAGIQCNANGRVNGLSIDDNIVGPASGVLPSSLGNLTELKQVGIFAEFLSGTIPVELLRAPKLIYLGVNDAENLDYSFVEDLSQASILETLAIVNNTAFDGNIPSSIGLITTLNKLDLSNNSITGSIPTEIGNLTSLTVLDLSNNELSGDIPSSIGSLTGVIDFILNDNNLSGPIPNTLGDLGAQFISLHNNELTGEIPAGITSNTNLTYLDLSDNMLSGCLPQDLQNMCTAAGGSNNVYLDTNPELGDQQNFNNWCNSGQVDADSDGENVFCDCDDNDPDNGSTIALGAFNETGIESGVVIGLGGGTPLGGVYSGVGVTDDGNGQTFTFDPSIAGEGIVTITYANIDCETSATSDIVVVSGTTQCTILSNFICNESNAGPGACDLYIASLDNPIVMKSDLFTDDCGGCLASIDINHVQKGSLTGSMLVELFQNGQLVDQGINSAVVIPGFGTTTIALEEVLSLDPNADYRMVVYLNHSLNALSASNISIVGVGSLCSDTDDDGVLDQDDNCPDVANVDQLDGDNDGIGTLCDCDDTDDQNACESCPQPITFIAPDDLCFSSGVQLNLSGGLPIGGVYSGPGVTDDGNGETYTFDPSIAGAGIVALSYFYDDGNGCSITRSDEITIFGDIAPPIPSGPSTEICQGDLIPPLVVTPPAGATVDWYDAPSGGNLLRFGNSEGQSVYINNNPGTYYAESRDLNTGCLSTVRTAITLTINPQPTLTILETECDVENDQYAITLQMIGDDLEVSRGVINDLGSGSFIITAIPVTSSVIVRAINNTDCEVVEVVDPPNCCDAVAPRYLGDEETCGDEPFPALTVSVGSTGSVNWYSAAVGGNLLATGTASFIPDNPGTYYAEYVKSATCISPTRTAVELIDISVDITFPDLGDIDQIDGIQTNLGGAEPSGGTYSGQGVTDNGNGLTFTFDPNIAGGGIQIITYSLDGICMESGSSNVNVIERCPEPRHPDYNAVIALYDALNGSNWPIPDFQNWHDLKNKVICDPCQLEGVTCGFGNRIFRLDIRNELAWEGELPPEIGQLSGLTELILVGNLINGELPSELGTLSALTNINLSDNEFDGEIPPELGNLNALRELFLGGNEFTGNIPPELGNLSSILQISLRDNQLSGEVPAELGSLTNIFTLSLFNNKLEGCLPIELLNLCGKNVSLTGNALLGYQQNFDLVCSSGIDNDSDGVCALFDCDDNDPFDGTNISFADLGDQDYLPRTIPDLGGGLPAGGVYSGIGVTDNGNGQTFTFDPRISGDGDFTITYSNVDCGTSATSTITINPFMPTPCDFITSDTIYAMLLEGESELEVCVTEGYVYTELIATLKINGEDIDLRRDLESCENGPTIFYFGTNDYQSFFNQYAPLNMNWFFGGQEVNVMVNSIDDAVSKMSELDPQATWEFGYRDNMVDRQYFGTNLQLIGGGTGGYGVLRFESDSTDDEGNIISIGSSSKGIFNSSTGVSTTLPSGIHDIVIGDNQGCLDTVTVVITDCIVVVEQHCDTPDNESTCFEKTLEAGVTEHLIAEISIPEDCTRCMESFDIQFSENLEASYRVNLYDGDQLLYFGNLEDLSLEQSVSQTFNFGENLSITPGTTYTIDIEITKPNGSDSQTGILELLAINSIDSGVDADNDGAGELCDCNDEDETLITVEDCDTCPPSDVSQTDKVSAFFSQIRKNSNKVIRP